jgi:uncharacterized protein (DUF697 family)/tellurite resistance protein
MASSIKEQTMNPEQAILTISLFAAFSDGTKDDREREHIRRFAESLGPEAPDLARVYQDVLFGRVRLSDAVAGLTELGHRQLAYEMAVCVCDADGVQSEAEHLFLVELKKALDLVQDTHSAEIEREADALAGAAVVAGGIAAVSADPAPASAIAPGASDAELDRSILNYSILNGALELLPQSWASVAIIPLQIRMVYGVGKAHGYELDQGHIREFLATVGVGLTSQYLEQFGRKLLGGLLGKLGGKALGGVGRAATGMAFSFASTYALGQVAKRYYAGGRQMSTQLLQESFQNLLGPAKQMQAQYLSSIREKAGTLDAGQIMSLVRGGPV